MIGFLVTCAMTFLTVEGAIDKIFGVERRKGRILHRLFSFSLVVVWGPLAIAGLVTLLLHLAQNPAFSGYLRRSTLVHWLPPLITLLGLTLLFWWVPNRKVRIRNALAGAAVATIALHGLQIGFSAYVRLFTAASRVVYGSFAIAFFFMISVQIAWWLVLVGCEVTACLELERDHALPGAPPAPAPPAPRTCRPSRLNGAREKACAGQFFNEAAPAPPGRAVKPADSARWASRRHGIRLAPLRPQEDTVMSFFKKDPPTKKPSFSNVTSGSSSTGDAPRSPDAPRTPGTPGTSGPKPDFSNVRSGASSTAPVLDAPGTTTYVVRAATVCRRSPSATMETPSSGPASTRPTSR